MNTGLHFKIYWQYPTVNIPYWAHRVLVIGRGRLRSNGTFNHWGVCCYRMHLQYCCGRNKESAQ